MLERIKTMVQGDQRNTFRVPSKEDSLTFLKNNGLDIQSILDIGVQHETKELKGTFPSLKHYLFEPVEEYYPFIEKNYRDIDYVLYKGALSDRTGEDSLNVRKLGSDTVTHSSLDNHASENEESESRPIQTSTLDDFLKDQGATSTPYLLKLDVDGYELPILRGAEDTLANCSCIIIEAPLYHLPERLNYLIDKGFWLWDIVDLCYYYGNLHQVDLIFLNPCEKQKAPFSPWQNFKFKWDEWKELKEVF